MEIKCGAYRCVLLLDRYVIKLPRGRDGMRCNAWEREMWRHWRPQFAEWRDLLCPVLLADPFGLFVVMPRARQSVALADALTDDLPYPGTGVERKPENLGWLDGKLVEIDYGLADVGAIGRRRQEYTTAAAARIG